MNGAQVPLAVGLNALTAGLILISAFGTWPLVRCRACCGSLFCSRLFWLCQPS